MSLKLPYDRFTLKEEYFINPSDVHGVKHTYRVMYHVLNLGRVHEEDLTDYEVLLAFCAAFIHDMAREHDGIDASHGRRAADMVLPEFKNLFVEVGVLEEDLDIIATAVEWHSVSGEETLQGREYRVTALLKDADGLDRVRLGDLDPSYFRFPRTADFVEFAKEFYYSTQRKTLVNFYQVMATAEQVMYSLKMAKRH